MSTGRTAATHRHDAKGGEAVITGPTGHADDCTDPTHPEIDCPADDLTITPDGPDETGDIIAFRTTSPSGVKRAHIAGEITLGAPALTVLIGHLQHLHRAIAG
jgi:hypothetical protein